MEPIRTLMNRIVWDREFGSGDFEIGYYDRVADKIVRIGFAEMVIEPGNKDSFLALNADGVYQRIPLHRVRVVYRDNEIIWQRPGKN